MKFHSKAQLDHMCRRVPSMADQWRKQCEGLDLPERVGEARDPSQADPALVAALKKIQH